MKFSQRVADLQPEGAYEYLARAQALEAQGRSIIHLEVGEPDIATYPEIAQAGVRAIEQGHTRYNPPSGIRELREAIALDAGRRRGVEFSPGQVLVSPGAKPNMFFATLALLEPGDEAIYPDPGFPTYLEMIRVAGGVPRPVRLSEEDAFAFDLDDFDRLTGPKTRLIVLNSPANPTGGVMSRRDLEHIAAAAEAYDCWVISDEIYARLVYDGQEAPSIISVPGMEKRTIVVDGFSKTFAMSGWRLGYGILPEDLARKVELLLTHAYGCAADFTQRAGLAALQGDQSAVDQSVRSYQRRRDVLLEGLRGIPGIRCQRPGGAFYAFPNVQAYGLPAGELADRILEEAGVALLPGTAFGRYGEGYLRLSYANSLPNLEEAVRRLQKFFRNL